jgi:hypothetical protein
LVGENTDDAVLDCYWLARWYHQSPEHFLAMPISTVRMHVIRTHQIAAEMQALSGLDDGD